MEKACYIGLDIGSSAIKGVLTDASGAILAEYGLEHRVLAPYAEWAELEPWQHLENVCSILQRLALSAPSPVRALAMAVASGNTLLTSEAGEPLGNIISWMDGRARHAPPGALAGLRGADLHAISGWPCIDSFPLAHLAWLKENQPGLLESAGHVGMDSDWLLRQLCGQRRMDHSTATTFHLQHQVAGDYHQPYLDLLGIRRGQLPTLVPSGTPCGRILPEMAARTGLSTETMVVAGSFDHPAAARAVGVTEPGQLMLSCGTSWVALIPCRERARVIEAAMLCDPFLSHAGGCWAGMFSVPQIGRQISWYIDNAIAPRAKPEERPRIFDELAATAPPGANGVTLDLRLPPELPQAEPADIARAVMEGAARLIAEKLASLSRLGFTYSEAVMVGGPSRSPVWPEIVATFTGLRIRVGGRGAGARGAALLAMRA